MGSRERRSNRQKTGKKRRNGDTDKKERKPRCQQFASPIQRRSRWEPGCMYSRQTDQSKQTASKDECNGMRCTDIMQPRAMLKRKRNSNKRMKNVVGSKVRYALREAALCLVTMLMLPHHHSIPSYVRCIGTEIYHFVNASSIPNPQYLNGGRGGGLNNEESDSLLIMDSGAI
jgi:hypothetical protein